MIGLHNSAGEVFNVTHIAGSINAPQAFHYYVQNFTFQVTSRTVDCLDLARSHMSLALTIGELCYAAIQLTVEARRAGIVAVHIQARQLSPCARMAAVFDSILAVNFSPRPAFAHHLTVQTDRCASMGNRDKNTCTLLNAGIYLYLCRLAQRSYGSVTVFFDIQEAIKHGLCGAHN